MTRNMDGMDTCFTCGGTLQSDDVGDWWHINADGERILQNHPAVAAHEVYAVSPLHGQCLTALRNIVELFSSGHASEKEKLNAVEDGKNQLILLDRWLESRGVVR